MMHDSKDFFFIITINNLQMSIKIITEADICKSSKVCSDYHPAI